MADQYVPVSAAAQSEVAEKVNVSIPTNTLKMIALAVVVGIVLFMLYKHFNSNEEKKDYVTRSERMIAQARGNVKRKNKEQSDNDEFSDFSNFSDISNLTEEMKNYEKNKKNKKNQEVKGGSENEEFFDPLSEENYNESNEQEQEQELREAVVEGHENAENENMMNNIQPGGRMGPGMMDMGGIGESQLAGIPEE
jgi:hypothetical protein